MSDAANRAGLEYFLPPKDWFWKWQEQGRVVTWHDGLTIAFRDELEAILRHLAPQGWPPLGSLVLLLAACRDNWRDTPGRAIGLTSLLTRLSTASGVQDSTFAALRSLCDGLDCVRDLPSDLRYTLSARAALAGLVFETAKECTTDAAAAELLDDWPQWRADELRTEAREASLSEFRAEIYALLGGLSKVDERTLRLRLQTGLDALPEPAPLSLERSASVRAVMDELADDPELYGVISIARQLLSVVSLPRPLSIPADLPDGGVSDISNRGPLDRLLLSELAHDDLTLASRVALNEALFYRRETPPSPRPRTRKLLLDSGVRMWGVPRVFAAAVGIALAASREQHLETTAFRARERTLAEVDLRTREGLVAHLGALETAAHPGEALPEFQAESGADSAAAEGVLITCEEVLADPDFQRALARYEFKPLYIATVSRAGRFRLMARSPRGSKVLREATLDLDKLLAPNPRCGALLDSSQIPLPAIFGVEPFPLLLSVPFEVERSWRVGGAGAFTYTRDGRLLRWTSLGRGALQMADGMPQGRLLACQGIINDSKTLAVVGKVGPNGMWVVQIDLTEPRVTWNRLQFPHVPQLPVVIYRDRVLLRHRGNCVVLDAYTGELLSQSTLSAADEQIGRVIRQSDGHGFVALTLGHDGVATWSTPSRSPFSPPLAAFEAEGIEGIVMVMRNGSLELESPAGKQTIPVSHGLRFPLIVCGVSRDGRRFALRGSAPAGAPANYAIVTIKNERMRPVTVESANQHSYSNQLEPFLSKYIRPRTLRTKFSGICLTRNRELALVGRKRAAWPMVLDRSGRNLRLARMTEFVPSRYFQFQDDVHNTRGYPLQRCQFPDGSLAWLDGRGLLHLRSSDRALPEATIVLGEHLLAGWLSDGRVWGPDYFHGEAAVDPTQVYDEVFQPMIERMAR